MPRIQVYFTDLEYKKIKEKPTGFIRRSVRLALLKKEENDKRRSEEKG